VSPAGAIVVLETLSAVALTELIELPVPATLIVPPPVALKPAPVVVSMSSPPPVKLIVAPVLVARLTAAPAPVLMTLLALVNAIVPPVLSWTEMPVPPVMLSAPENVTLLVVWLATSIDPPALLGGPRRAAACLFAFDPP
jgi:hypothetical protein